MLKNEEANHPQHQLPGLPFLNELDVFVFIFDLREMKPAWLNDFFYSRLKYTEEDLEKLTADEFAELFHPRSLTDFQIRLRALLQESSPGIRTIYQVKTKTGDWVYLMVTSRIYERNQDGTPNTLLGLATEIDLPELERHQKHLESLNHKKSACGEHPMLTNREIEVVRLIVSGMTDKEICGRLKVSIHTAKTHRKRILKKLDLKNSVALVKFAMENHII
ncbi:MAG: response regulator transcription factor [Bacteroidales bacterium]|nr:response regulator transcription factor [Bacteroidales bacterium]